MERMVHHDRIIRLCAEALSKGARRASQYRIVWDCAGDCSSPKHVETLGRPEGRETFQRALARIKREPERSAQIDGLDLVGQPRVRRHSLRMVLSGAFRRHGLLLETSTRCRRCENCLRVRQRAWAYRCKAEFAASARTWLCTLTVRPEDRFRFLTAARQSLTVQGLDFETLPPEEQFIAKHGQISKELTRWLKRVRKNSAASFKYILVAEEHKDGEPHYHAMIHERDIGSPVRHSVLTGAWRVGFSRFRLIEDERDATYSAKYLGKSSLARVRASRGYGSANAAFSGSANALKETSARDKEAPLQQTRLKTCELRPDLLTEQSESDRETIPK